MQTIGIIALVVVVLGIIGGLALRFSVTHQAKKQVARRMRRNLYRLRRKSYAVTDYFKIYHELVHDSKTYHIPLTEIGTSLEELQREIPQALRRQLTLVQVHHSNLHTQFAKLKGKDAIHPDVSNEVQLIQQQQTMVESEIEQLKIYLSHFQPAQGR